MMAIIAWASSSRFKSARISPSSHASARTSVTKGARDVLGGTGSRCSWTNVDPDWYSGSVQCSWSDTQNVGSAYNRGTSSAYGWVVLYTGANYTGTGYCIPQNGGSWSSLNVRIRSHRWEAFC